MIYSFKCSYSHNQHTERLFVSLANFYYCLETEIFILKEISVFFFKYFFKNLK